MNPVIRPSIGIPPSQVASTSANAPKSAPISSLLADLSKFSPAKTAPTPSFGSGLNTLG